MGGSGLGSALDHYTHPDSQSDTHGNPVGNTGS